MFLIDKSGSLEQWNIQFADHPNPFWRSEIPVKLPRIQKFSNEVLTNWIRGNFSNLHQFVDDIEMTAQEVLSKSDDGIPESVFQEIFKLSECEWCDEWFRL